MSYLAKGLEQAQIALDSSMAGDSMRAAQALCLAEMANNRASAQLLDEAEGARPFAEELYMQVSCSLDSAIGSLILGDYQYTRKCLLGSSEEAIRLIAEMRRAGA